MLASHVSHNSRKAEGRTSVESYRCLLVTSCGLTALFLILHLGSAFAESDLAPDTENCLLCHRYPYIGRYDKTGAKRIFYVNDKWVYKKSVMPAQSGCAKVSNRTKVFFRFDRPITMWY